MNIFFKKFGGFILDWTMPKECFGCSSLGKYLCEYCEERLRLRSDFICPACHKPCLQGQVHEECVKHTYLDGLVVAGYHHDRVLKDVLHAFKYESARGLSESLGRILLRKVQDSPLLETVLMSCNTILISVPLHEAREWERGYNQAECLVEELSKSFPIQLQDLVVKRTKKTKRQTGLDKDKRKENLKGVFEIVDSLVLEGRNVVLVDDVITSGATLNELAGELKKAGVDEVWGLAVAHG